MKELLINSFDKSIPIVFLQAHCDDESFLCSGLLKRLSLDGYEVILVYCASALVDKEPKTVIRQQELFKVCKELGIQDVRFLDFCEPKYDPVISKPLFLQNEDYVLHNLEVKVGDILKRTFNVISYDENGGYGNIDHVIVSKIGRLFLRKYFEIIDHFYEVTINRDVYINWIRGNKKTLPPECFPQLEYWREDFGLQEKDISDLYKLSEQELIHKREMLSLHESQIKKNLFPLSLKQDDFSILFGTEYFYNIK